MLIDPSIRLPVPQPQQQQVPPQNGSQPDLGPPQHNHSQHPQIAANMGLDLLVAASFDSQPGAGNAVTAAPGQYDPAAVVAASATHAAAHNGAYYTGHPQMVNDGFDHELEYYVDSGPHMQTSIWGAPNGMFTSY